MAVARISNVANKILHALAVQKGETMQAIFDKAIELYRRKCILEESNQAFGRLSVKPKQADKDDALWNNTLSDGLEED